MVAVILVLVVLVVNSGAAGPEGLLPSLCPVTVLIDPSFALMTAGVKSAAFH